MLGLFGALNMAGQALAVDQQQTIVTGNNLANVNNPAYAREQVNVQEAPSVYSTAGQEGSGVVAVSITQVRNALIDTQIQSENSVTGSLNTQQTTLENAEAYLNETISGTDSSTASANGLTAGLSTFFNSLQTLSTDPTNISDRQSVIYAGQQLAQQFNQISSGLSTVTSGMDNSIQSDVTSSNEDLKEISNLNQQIITIQASGQSANDLIDTRQKAIEDLASKVNITTSAQNSGAVNISIGGVQMVNQASQVNSLTTITPSGGDIQIADANSNTQLSLTGGSIEGNISARDGAIANLQQGLNTLANQVIGLVNGTYASGYDLNGNTGQNFFTGSDATNIGVNTNLLTNPSTFQAAGAPNTPGDNTIVKNMAALATTKVTSLSNQTLTSQYTSTVNSFGASLQAVNQQLADSTGISTMLTNQRSSISGVDTDTEMTNLMQYQKAYQASAELISTINQMLETVVSMKTV